MAERRMFAKSIIDSDAFLDMPASTQNLYFHLAMRGDDDGFVNSPFKIMRVVNAHKNDMDLLIAKQFVIPFESGICVIKHWKIHNYLRADRYKPSIYTEERNKLTVDEANMYLVDSPIGLPLGIPKTDFGIPDGIPVVDAGKVRIGKSNKDKKNKDKEYVDSSSTAPKKSFIKPQLSEVIAYCEERQNGVDAEKWMDHYTSNGWKVGKNPMKDWKAAVRTWERTARGSSKVAKTGQAAKRINLEEARAQRERELDLFRQEFGELPS